MRNKTTQEYVAVKYIARQVTALPPVTTRQLSSQFTLTVNTHKQITTPLQAGVGLSVSTERELVNHRKLLHPNVIRYVCGHCSVIASAAGKGSEWCVLWLGGQAAEWLLS